MCAALRLQGREGRGLLLVDRVTPWCELLRLHLLLILLLDNIFDCQLMPGGAVWDRIYLVGSTVGAVLRILIGLNAILEHTRSRLLVLMALLQSILKHELPVLRRICAGVSKLQLVSLRQLS